MGWGVGGVWG
jgi:hypothetical protein